ncbi:hypothetical protein N9V68_00535 [Octadecabacter sp.]|nr:hypothetical protein [Octadecabacter sp.]
MDLSAASLWEWTKLFVRDPRLAARLVKEASLPLEVSVMMIVLAGVVSTAASGVYTLIIGSPDMIFAISETEALSITPIGPIGEGLFAVFSGVGMAYAIFRVGARFGGTGTLADIMAIMAVLQLVVTVIMIIQLTVGLIIPLIGFILAIFATYVFFRGLGHTVNEGHNFGSMGKSVWIIFGSFLALSLVAVAVLILIIVLDLGPSGTLVSLPLSEGTNL